ncbi:hypothetical protein G6F70_003663 [Rhizopus microsporus]|uniref:SAM domain and HD n=2 Tax=Rhizopus TaxID=4842 RepID=A0A367JKZ5_RHIAZ|nr:hypothetical protein G6F71_003656 [Rhizopus microsporus]RCH90624.1 SAM domain and HD [Rhizopus azygosporus]KAG1200883.1 hypothetical protein G6F70_003663 [Rhizopus microsporus]KAG1212758.1 hypothetical protein G6F69_003431 [Rhizopus microsporus]KAG1230588.1 hypothetical protein G6F67_006361 [Rhizopus microsporus]
MSINNIVNTFENANKLQEPKSFFHGHKVINDPIHGHILLDNYTVEFIDTLQFQRLRDLKQLGVLYYVFPGGSHNRFEHSIGVSHLAGTLVERFAREQPELEITKDEIKCVKLAGLCHDLGHGPFSHVFDNTFMPLARPGQKWTHEQGSERMLEYLIDDNHIDIEKDEVNFIKELIAGEARSQSKYKERQFLFDIVANKKNSVDVDKFDYIERDSYNLGLRSSYDANRLLVYSRVINNEICYHQKEVYNLYEMFHTRYSLFKQIYTHRVGTAIELMIVDAFLAANDYLKIADMVDNPEDYLYLTDNIVHTIECSKCPELEEARGIIKRIRKRELYKFVDEFLVPPELEGHLNQNVINAQNIVNYQSDNAGLVEDDVIVRFTKINYAMNDNNPVDSIRFFSKFNENESFNISKQKVSYMIPSKFQDVNIRVFTRNPQKMQAVQKAFRKCLKEITNIQDLDPTVPVSEEYQRLASLKRQRFNGN